MCEQGFKPAFETLRQNGVTVVPDLTDDGYDFGLCLITKHKAETLANLGRGWAALKLGGILVCAGSNDVGAGSIERAFKAAIGGVSALSKSHCKVFWAKRGDTIPPTLADWAEAGRTQLVPETGCWSRPGLYNWNKIDAGSALLAKHIPADLSGRVADLGAGWGYLSLALLDRAPAIASLDLFEAEWHAIEAAKLNLSRVASPARLGFHWHDVAAGLPKATFDIVVMNPPFHQGKATDIDLGRAFIAAAAAALVPGGRLLFVANRQLPYEPVVAAHFRSSTTLDETALYKVILAHL
ncbi:class I SAM-dependent methyltransferase [Magnetospirillum molischianum]|uniref:16S RNA G1207 methylase RsmC n=1 Tax=Magnetospirillum molischianum DSM 120 TaxID=1150626 RepID=H8FVI4_MAGML|nr:class I SAM-dependent methyltransferase [Magnetospirillum molischianum]CCG42372.1 16S RNA G1207 methylase RsmC [Magnetospirillum molischianum DSM 120]